MSRKNSHRRSTEPKKSTANSFPRQREAAASKADAPDLTTAAHRLRWEGEKGKTSGATSARVNGRVSKGGREKQCNLFETAAHLFRGQTAIVVAFLELRALPVHENSREHGLCPEIEARASDETKVGMSTRLSSSPRLLLRLLAVKKVPPRRRAFAGSVSVLFSYLDCVGWCTALDTNGDILGAPCVMMGTNGALKSAFWRVSSLHSLSK